MSASEVIVVGADKGGVGKTVVARALMDYFSVNAIEHRAFDTQPGGVLKRFFPSRTELVDLTDSDDQMKVFDTLGSAVTVIDVCAGLLTPTMKMLKNIGYLDPAKCRITVLHVLGNSQASIAEVQEVMRAVSSSRYIAVANHINETKFAFPAGSLDIPAMNAKACESVDESNLPFITYGKSGPSGVLRGYVNHWLTQVFAQFDAAKLNEPVAS
jgi:hypothetical protein